MVESFANVKQSLSKGGRMVVIVNDKLGFTMRSGTGLVSGRKLRLERHVNRRTSAAGDFLKAS